MMYLQDLQAGGVIDKSAVHAENGQEDNSTVLSVMRTEVGHPLVNVLLRC